MLDEAERSVRDAMRSALDSAVRASEVARIMGCSRQYVAQLVKGGGK